MDIAIFRYLIFYLFLSCTATSNYLTNFVYFVLGTHFFLLCSMPILWLSVVSTNCATKIYQNVQYLSVPPREISANYCRVPERNESIVLTDPVPPKPGSHPPNLVRLDAALPEPSN